MKIESFRIASVIVIIIISFVVTRFYGGYFIESIENIAVANYIRGTRDIRSFTDSKNTETERKDIPNEFTISWPYVFWADSYKTDIILDDEIIMSYTVTRKQVSQRIYNLLPDHRYLYKVYACHNNRLFLIRIGNIRPTGAIRMIFVDGLYNVRDIGGWKTTDGKCVSYGKIFRGSEMNGSHDIHISTDGQFTLSHQLNITADLDFRTSEESLEIMESPIGKSVGYVRIPIKSYLEFVADPKEQLIEIMDVVTSNDIVYMHCWGGCDRTGTISWLLLGLLGVAEADLDKDYELSSFSVFGERTVDSDAFGYSEMVEYIKRYPGATLQEKIENYFLDNGVECEIIEKFKDKMLR